MIFNGRVEGKFLSSFLISYMVLFGGLTGVIFDAEQLRFEPTAGVEMSNGFR